MKYKWLVLVVVLASMLFSSLVTAHSTAHDQVTMLVGAGEDTTAVNAFLPERIIIRVGNTVTWRLNSDEVHTVTFPGGEPLPPFEMAVPGGEDGEFMLNPQAVFPTRMPGEPIETYEGNSYVNSGLMSRQPQGPDAPPNDTFSLMFTEPGLYEYYCALHPEMRGIVEVLPENAEVPSQIAISEQAEAEMLVFLAKVEAARELGEMVRSEPGPDGTTIWYVNAGAVDMTGDLRAQSFDFLPGNLTIQTGDTVVWMSPSFHTVTFVPLPPGPEFVVAVPQDAGPPLLLLNPEVVLPAKPAGIYNELQYYNSGLIGLQAPFGEAWVLTFNEPGTYEYFCAVHRELGMEGTITVVNR